jgi:site-specific DNA-methyltransferase (adenine-specific)
MFTTIPKLMNIVIFHGDSLPILSSEIASNSVDMIFLDPPYNIGKHFADFYDKWESENDYINWANQILDQCLRILKPQGTLYVMARHSSNALL